MKVEYDSNNSGGDWWVSDEGWRALESAGWEVEWRKDAKGQTDRWLGALATRAFRHGLTLEQAVDEWERLTGCNSTDAGCPCCGNPHSFTEYDDDGKYVRSGPSIDYECSW